MVENKQLWGISAGLMAALIWGGWPVLSKLALTQSLSGYDITALRFSIAGLLLAPVLYVERIQFKLIVTKGAVLAIGAGAPYVLLSSYGLNFAPAGHFGIIAPSCMLIFTLVGSSVFLKESISASRLFGVMLILLGIVVVGISSLITVSVETLFGDLMFVGCGLLWASYTVLCKRWGIKPLIATAMVSFVSLLIFMPGYFATQGTALFDVGVETLLMQGLFQGVLAAIVALFLYSKAVELLGSSQGALFAALVPAVALLMSVPVLGESIGLTELGGVCVVTLGMLIALELIPVPVRRRMRKKASSMS